MGGEITEIKKRLDTVSTLLSHAGIAGVGDSLDLLSTAGELLHRINEDVIRLTPTTLSSKFATSPLWEQIVRLTALQKRKDLLTELVRSASCEQQQRYG